MEALAAKIRTADAFVFVVGEYNWGMQPGLKNLTDHFLERLLASCRDRELLRRAPERGPLGAPLAGTLSEMGMVVISSTLAVGPISTALSPTGEPRGEAGQKLTAGFPIFADDLGSVDRGCQISARSKAAALLSSGFARVDRVTTALNDPDWTRSHLAASAAAA